ncbi:MAG: hypothetical protein VXZ72_04400 [Chlamydiota bacterium]|nr:hypothetical protein [Chlamydiota bacterium]
MNKISEYIERIPWSSCTRKRKFEIITSTAISILVPNIVFSQLSWNVNALMSTAKVMMISNIVLSITESLPLFLTRRETISSKYSHLMFNLFRLVSYCLAFSQLSQRNANALMKTAKVIPGIGIVGGLL